MRFIFGLIVGIALTLGIAYVHDKNVPAPGTPPATDANAPAATDLTNRPVVNWDTLSAITDQEVGFVKEQWNKVFH